MLAPAMRLPFVCICTMHSARQKVAAADNDDDDDNAHRVARRKSRKVFPPPSSQPPAPNLGASQRTFESRACQRGIDMYALYVVRGIYDYYTQTDARYGKRWLGGEAQGGELVGVIMACVCLWCL